MNKQECRRQTLLKRDALLKDIVEKNSDLICKSLQSLGKYQHVMTYLATGNESNIDQYIDYLIKEGVSVYVPVCTGKGIMEASLLQNPESDLEIGTFGIRAPKKEAYHFVDPDILDLVIVPGVGFDKNGNRLGFGGGFYDRYLPRTRKDCKKIAVCHDMQILENAFPEVHDFPMDAVVTETQIYYFKK